MKGVSTDAIALHGNLSISPTTRVIAEINQNRYNDFDQAYVDANLSTYYGATGLAGDGDYYRNRFPVSSVVNAIRPQSSGMAWARKMPFSFFAPASRPYNVIHSVKVYNKLGTAGTAPTATAAGDYLKVNPRLYHVGPGISYQNYSKESSEGANDQWTAFSTDIKYTTAFWTNKISIGFENTMGDPSASGGLSVSVQLESGTWSSIGSSLSIDSDGRLNLYRTSGTYTDVGVWNPVRPIYSDATYWDSSSSTIPTAGRIKGIRVSSATPSGPVTLIEVRPSLITDITHRVVSWDWTANIAEQDSLHPVGTVSSNTGSIVLANGDQDFSPQERSSTVCRIAELSREYCEFVTTVTVNPGTTSDIPQFYAFSRAWQDSSDNNYSLDLVDIIGILQETQAPQLVLEGASPTQAIWRALDMVGVGPVRIRRLAGESENIYPAVYADKDQTLWDFIKSICADSKYSVYADEEGFINIATNSYIFDSTRSSEWTFYGEDSGVTPFADIQEATIEKTDPVNTVNLKYSPVRPISSNSNPTNATKGNILANISFADRTLWKPSKGISLGLATLAENMNSTSSGGTAYIKVFDNAFTAGNWGQFSGYLLIDKEVIKYESVEFSYISTESNELVKRKVKSVEEYSEMLSGAKGRVGFTGYFYETTRGQFGTTPAAHSSPISLWSKSPAPAVTTGTSTDPNTGVVTRSLKINGSTVDGKPTAYRDFVNLNNHYFSNVTISSKAAPYSAGMVVWPQVSAGVINGGIWVELIVGIGISIYKTVNGKYVPGSKKLLNATIPYNKPIEIWVDRITKAPKSGYSRWYLYIGKTYIGYHDIANSGLTSRSGLGLFARGKTIADFNYAGGSRSAKKGSQLSNTDNIKDLNEMIKNILSDKSGVTTRNDLDLDNFDAAVRGVYYEKIHFQNGPARNVDWYPFSNSNIKRVADTGKYTQIARSGDVASDIFSQSPWNAEIILANTSNRPVLLHGDKSNFYPVVYGKVFERGNEQKATKENKQSIARYGIKPFDATLPWTSDRAAAEKIAQQIIDVSSDGTQYIQITSFTNHLISLCDPVTIQYAVKNLDATQKFVVCEINSSWSDGLQYTFKVVKQTSE